MDQIKQLKDYCDEISLDDLRFVKVRQKIEKMHEQNNITIIDFIKQKEKEIEGKGRILVRASGTEPLIRVMVEGETQETVDTYIEALVGKVKELLL